MGKASSDVRDRLKKKLEEFTPAEISRLRFTPACRPSNNDYLTTNYDTFLVQILES